MNTIYDNYEANIKYHNNRKSMNFDKNNMDHMIMVWNVDGRLRIPKGTDHNQRQYPVQRVIEGMRPLVFIATEPYGFKGNGYKGGICSNNFYDASEYMYLAAHDKYGATAIWVDKSVDKCVAIPPNDQLFNDLHKDRKNIIQKK